MKIEEYSSANAKLKEVIENIEAGNVAKKAASKLAKALIAHSNATRPDPKIIPYFKNKETGRPIFFTEHIELAKK